ncbi:MAG: TolC family protein [Myxococcota bacterium]|nr:TolC family protein [Myxococcota bacterium]
MISAAPLMISLLLTAEPGTPLQLQPFLDEVSRQAPRVRAQQANVETAQAAVGVAGSAQDPLLGLMVEGFGRTTGQMLTYRFTQPLDFVWRRGPEKSVARAKVAQSQARGARTVWDARAEAARAFYELWRSHEQDQVLARQLTVLEGMRISAQARYETGSRTAHHAMLRAEAEIAMIRAERAALEAERLAMAAMINALRNQPQGDPVGRPELPPRTPLPSLESLVSRTGKVPEVSSAQAMRTEAEARGSLARSMYLPMPMAGVFFQHEPQMNTGAFGGEVGFSIPLWSFDRQANEVAMAGAMQRAAQREVEAMSVMAEAQLRAAWSRAVAADVALNALEKSALPRLRQTVESAEAEYRSGGEGFLELLEAVLALQRLEGDLATKLADRGLAWLELERILGGPLLDQG